MVLFCHNIQQGWTLGLNKTSVSWLRRQASDFQGCALESLEVWLSEEALQIAVKRREVKSKGEKERYKHLNAESQRIARKEKKAFFSDQCKEIEENNTMGRTRDLFPRRQWHPTPVLLPGNSYAWRSLVGYTTRGR